MGGPSGHLKRERGISVLNAEVLELVTELANDVLKSHDDLVSTSELFLEPRHARISLQPVLRRSRDNPVPLNELAESARGFAFASLPSAPLGALPRRLQKRADQPCGYVNPLPNARRRTTYGRVC